ncbi:MAG: DUF1549 and DUF1553 domain-containing protein [Planctomycetes bacterium]|nr:DUF1549 and DUF1553 domain-containing protein [Planctomycetota bacterium]
MTSPSMRVNVALLLALAIAAFPPFARAADGERPLHQQIDTLVAKRLAELKIVPAEASSDAEFLRRIYLDLTGVIPTATQARSFLDDKSPNKRSRLIDELLASPDYILHMARVFDVMLAERRVATINSYDVTTAAWRTYLAGAFAENKPWDRITREILGSDGADEKFAGAAKFYLVRDVAPHQLTRDIGRLFLGVDLQCAQCHDDPRFKDYRQADYFGIFAFTQRMKLHPMTPRGALVAETAVGKTTFTSVFTAKSGETNPRLPGGAMIADPALEKGKEYVVQPGPKERGIPSYSRRLKLAEQLPRPETQGFSRNIANRLWAMVMGRGIVYPLDLNHAANPPSHPELLARLEQWLVEHKYDIKAMAREIVLSETYQRSSVLPRGVKKLPDEAFAVAPLRGLTAEQLRWSVLQATGRIEQHHAKLDLQQKKAPPSKTATVEPAWKVRNTRNDALERQSASLLAAFAGLPGQAEGSFQPVVDQALYLRNSTKLLPLLQDEPGTTLARLGAMREIEPLAEELYLSVLTRRPTGDEIADAKQLIELAKTPAERREQLQALMWGLLLSAEFRLNH